MFRLIVTVKQGTAANIPQAVATYATLDEARAAVKELLRHDRVIRIMIVANTTPSRFVEWVDR